MGFVRGFMEKYGLRGWPRINDLRLGKGLVGVILALFLLGVLLPPLATAIDSLEVLKAKLEVIQAKKDKIQSDYALGKLLMEASILKAEKLNLLEASLKKRIVEAGKVKPEEGKE